MAWYTDLHGDAWQDKCKVLLHVMFPHEVQPIFDKGGDKGLDFIVVNEGIIFQAYGQEPNCRDPLKSLKSKFEDLKKLQTNKEYIKKLFGDKKVVKWILIINIVNFNNVIHEYAKGKENDVKSWNLDYIDNTNFQIFVYDPSYLEKAHSEFNEKYLVVLPETEVPPLEQLYSSEKFVKIYEKFKLILDENTAKSFALEQIENFIKHEILLAKIKTEKPDYYEDIENTIAAAEAFAKKGSIGTGTYDSFQNAEIYLNNNLNNSIGSKIQGKSINNLQKFIMARWLIDCPLNFIPKKEE